jgi:hypothetical protein
MTDLLSYSANEEDAWTPKLDGTDHRYSRGETKISTVDELATMDEKWVP